MKKVFMFLALFLAVTLCEKIYSQDSSSPEVDCLSDKDFTFPEGKINEYFKGNTKELQKWVDEQTGNLEDCCKKATRCEKKRDLVNELLYIQKQLDDLGAVDVMLTSALCNGFLDITNTGVDINPLILELNVGETFIYDANVVVGDEICTGVILWWTDDPGIASINEYSGQIKANSIVQQLFMLL